MSEDDKHLELLAIFHFTIIVLMRDSVRMLFAANG